ncbi:MAG: hypothetical protein ACRD8Z_01910 [Nitrososphaeraceae archaeon]
MIPDEIIRRRIPPAYGNRIPHSEFIDQQDPSSLDFDGYSSHENNANPYDNTSSNSTAHVKAQRNESKESTGSHEMDSLKLFPGSYARRMATDQTMIASDIRKYLSSNHVNPLGSSSYFENRRRLGKFSYSF